MKKIVSWPEPKISSAKRAPGSYGSFREFMSKSEAIQAEQEAAQNFLKKAYPVMSGLLEHRLSTGEPLIVMRPLRYQTAELQGQNEQDDNFYNTRKSEGQHKFVDVVKTINPGTQLILKGIDTVLQEFLFEDAVGNEHALHFVEKNNLMTQTDIYEVVKEYMDNKGE